jgi:hypothetical protein
MTGTELVLALIDHSQQLPDCIVIEHTAVLQPLYPTRRLGVEILSRCNAGNTLI